jgi:MSHA pilin protein MshC
MDVLYHKIRGFTLLELIIVLMIIGILSIYAYFQWPSSTLSVEAQAQEIANDILYTQSLSMAHGQRYHIIKQSSSTYQILDASNNAVTFPNGSTTSTLNSGITFAWTNLPNNLIAFDGQGQPYTTTGTPGTAFSTATTYTITVSSNGATATITITPTTGMVSVQ